LNLLDYTSNGLRGGYQAALATNPDLKFGQYVGANRIVKNLRSRNRRVTTGATLQGLADGKSVGQRLQELSLSSNRSRRAKKTADREIKEIKRQK
jgi:hypothetical protein